MPTARTRWLALPDQGRRSTRKMLVRGRTNEAPTRAVLGRDARGPDGPAQARRGRVRTPLERPQIKEPSDDRYLRQVRTSRREGPRHDAKSQIFRPARTPRYP